MIVQHYVCDRCGQDTTEQMQTCNLPSMRQYDLSVHLCPDCMKRLAEYIDKVFLPTKKSKESDVK